MATGVSYAQTQPLVCPACGRRFDLAVWLIVDTAERPDLVARIRDGTIHAVVCPGCGAELGHADAPLLVYTPAPPTKQGRGGGSPSPLRRRPIGAVLAFELVVGRRAKWHFALHGAQR